MRERVTTDQIKLARTVDLISYMQQYEPEELIRTGPHDYKTATHSSLCISDNGLWHWYSRGIGGRGALNYLIQVKGMDFVSAVRHLCELELPAHAPFQPVKKIRSTNMSESLSYSRFLTATQKRWCNTSSAEVSTGRYCYESACVGTGLLPLYRFL